MLVKRQLHKECFIMLELYLRLEVNIFIILDIDEGTTAMDFLAQ
jgi:hypothetical protein